MDVLNAARRDPSLDDASKAVGDADGRVTTASSTQRVASEGPRSKRIASAASLPEFSTTTSILPATTGPRRPSRKEAGAYYTPQPVVESLMSWAVRRPEDSVLDPACGDGRFIAMHHMAAGVQYDDSAASLAREQAPWAKVHSGDFFTWASSTVERFDCAAGNPPFIRFQSFSREMRAVALAMCSRLGVRFSALASSWAPFLVVTAGLLRPAGRMAFVVPAEIGHAPYAAPLVEYLAGNFATVHLVAVRKKIFPGLSEDCWLLFADGFGGASASVRFTAQEVFVPSAGPPETFETIQVAEWRDVWNRRLRPFLLPRQARELYRMMADHPDVRRLGELASVGIGYVSGGNQFFHLRKSVAVRFGIPPSMLRVAVRNGRALPAGPLTQALVDQWIEADDPVLLLCPPKTGELPEGVRRYLDTQDGLAARLAYKCRSRQPWYVVPDLIVPDYFLSYMSGLKCRLVRNEARATNTNSVLALRLRTNVDAEPYLSAWNHPFVGLSCEMEGHPLGGGMLKLEPREAARILLPAASVLHGIDRSTVEEALRCVRSWRHYPAVPSRATGL